MKIKPKKQKQKMKIAKLKKWKRYHLEKGHTKLSWLMSTKSDKKTFLFKKKKNTKLRWPVSAKSDI